MTSRSTFRATVCRMVEVAVFGVLAVSVLCLIFIKVTRGGMVTDFENAFYGAADALRRGESPYVELDDPSFLGGEAYVYPPLTAIISIPFTVLSHQVAGIVVMALLVLTVVGILLTLGVRDWRCYGMAFLWPPIISAIQTGNITIPLALGASLIWRFRDRAPASAAAAGVTLAAKAILWPLLIWLGTTRRLRAAALSVIVGGTVLVVSWAAIGFAGVRQYPELLRRLRDVDEPFGYSVYALSLDFGTSDELARVLGLLLAVALLSAVVILGRRGDERRAFIVAMAAVLACSPAAWLHYFALLLVAVAVAEPRLGPAWFAPLAMYVSTGTLNGTTFQTAAVVLAAAVTVAAALRAPPPLPRTAGISLPRPAHVRGPT